MSVLRPRGSAKARLAVASVGALTAGLLAAIPLSGAQGAPGAPAASAAASPDAASAARGGFEHFTDGRYIVLMREASATGYDGDRKFA
ncbi:MAG: hypothetical protein Q7J48_14275, partial [Nocardioides sp.]|nr:hypothetical protein [Nocardioides sp.]